MEISPWFEYADANWSALYRYGVEHVVETGVTIYSAGQTANDIFIVKEGRVRLFHVSHDGKKRH